MKNLTTVITLFLCLITNKVHAAPVVDTSTEDRKHIIQALSRVSKETKRTLPLDAIAVSPIPGLLQVTSEGTILYITSDGRYLMSGELIDLTKDKNEWNLTEKAARQVWAKMLSQVAVKDMIVYPATKKKVMTITVFTDIDCGYCRKMQHDIDEYSNAGIEVRYLAYPRSGPGSASYEKAVTVWCDKDRAHAYTMAMLGKDLPKNKCKDNPVYKQYDLGRKMGISGTPTIFLENGTKIPGLVGPEALLKIINEQAK